jgi:hypothetical protein
MYQLFNGYHLGTNRAVFVMMPRPHTVTSDSDQTEWNIVGGQRRLEGPQDVFLVVSMPRDLRGLCVKAWLDTGHQEFLDSGAYDVLITRRWVAGCATFNDDVLVPSPVPRTPSDLRPTLIVGELNASPPKTLAAGAPGDSAQSGRAARIALVNQLNASQVKVRDGMLSSFGARKIKPLPLVQSNAFRRFLLGALRQNHHDLSRLAAHYVTPDELRALHGARIFTASDLFDPARPRSTDPANVIESVRSRLVDGVVKAAKAAPSNAASP